MSRNPYEPIGLPGTRQRRKTGPYDAGSSLIHEPSLKRRPIPRPEPYVITDEDARRLMREIFPEKYGTPWGRLKRWISARIHRYRVQRLQPGARVIGSVGTKGGEGVVSHRFEPGQYGPTVVYCVEFPDLSYPDTLVTPTGSYFLTPRDIYQIL